MANYMESESSCGLNEGKLRDVLMCKIALQEMKFDQNLSKTHLKANLGSLIKKSEFMLADKATSKGLYMDTGRVFINLQAYQISLKDQDESEEVPLILKDDIDFQDAVSKSAIEKIMISSQRNFQSTTVFRFESNECEYQAELWSSIPAKSKEMMSLEEDALRWGQILEPGVSDSMATADSISHNMKIFDSKAYISMPSRNLGSNDLDYLGRRYSFLEFDSKTFTFDVDAMSHNDMAWILSDFLPQLKYEWRGNEIEQNMLFWMLQEPNKMTENRQLAQRAGIPMLLMYFPDSTKPDLVLREIFWERDYKIVQVYGLIERGRRLYRKLLYTSDMR
jgi:hypothetical protein